MNIEKANAKGHIYTDHHTINMNEIYDVIAAILSTHECGDFTEKQAAYGIINLFLDEFQGINSGDVMPNANRPKKRLSAEDIFQ